jgi:uncharacterized protein
MLAERIASSQLADMAAQGVRLDSSLRVGELPRLSQVVARGPGLNDQPLEAKIGFQVGPEDSPVVGIRVQGALHLACQRCLGPMTWPLDVDVALTAVRSDAAAGDLADPFDSILLDEAGGLPLRAVVEDEILAVLPFAPLHADEVECRMAGVAAQGLALPATGNVNRPFADLGSLMGRQSVDSDEQ